MRRVAHCVVPRHRTKTLSLFFLWKFSGKFESLQYIYMCLKRFYIFIVTLQTSYKLPWSPKKTYVRTAIPNIVSPPCIYIPQYCTSTVSRPYYSNPYRGRSLYCAL